MADPNPYAITRVFKSSYTISEACDLMRILDKGPTPVRPKISWVDAKTRRPVIIGYND